MRNYSYFIGFFLVLCSLALIEYLVSPPLLYEGNTQLYEENRDDISIDIEKKDLPQKNFLSIFTSVGIKNVSLSHKKEVDHLFHFISVNDVDDSIRVLKTEYSQENEIKNQKKILVAYEIFSTKPRTVFSTYEYLKRHIKEDFSHSIESRIIEDNIYGDKSFSIRLEEGQKTMYIVVAHRDRLLGFEYPIDSLGSRHESIEKVLLQIFSQ